MKADAEKDLENALARRKQQALDRIAQSEAQALAEVRGTAVDVALAAAEKLIAGSLDSAKKTALADKAIGELQGRLN
jgi:F-type H+-transporting ATPase subunit b